MKALKWTQFPRPALIIILRKGFSEEEREKISLVREHWSNLVILYLGFVNISFRCYQAVPMMIALYQALLPSLVLFFFFFFSCLLFFVCLFWVFISFFFFFLLQFRLISFSPSWREMFAINLHRYHRMGSRLNEHTRRFRKVNTW